MIQRHKASVAFGGLGMGLILGLAGCSDSPPPDAAVTSASIPQPETPEQPEPPAAKERGKKSKDPFRDMGMREKREWRRQQKAKGAGD